MEVPCPSLDQRWAVIVELELASSQYATVAMREFMQGPPQNDLSEARTERPNDQVHGAASEKQELHRD